MLKKIPNSIKAKPLLQSRSYRLASGSVENNLVSFITLMADYKPRYIIVN